MFLLLLMGLGAAGVSAQVRIGGNTPPNASALLDLNATDATMNGMKGLALPRVNLTSPTMLLSGVTSNLTGMMVYNTTTTLGRIGVYFWNGAQWVNASLPTTSMADSGKFLMSNGTSWVTSIPGVSKGYVDTFELKTAPVPITWSLIIDTTWVTNRAFYTGDWAYYHIPGMYVSDICFGMVEFRTSLYTENGWVIMYAMSLIPNGTALRFRCYRPS